jgi:hypothetical protein
MHMIVTGRSEQERFSLRAEKLAHTGQNQMTDDFRACRPARFPRGNGAVIGAIQPISQYRDLG